MPRPNPYAGSALDRTAHRRGDQAWLAASRDDPRSRYVLVRDGRCLVREADPPCAALVSPGVVREVAPPDALMALLGVERGAAHFAVDVSGAEAARLAERLAPHGTFRDLRSVATVMPTTEAAMLAHARGILNWHARHRFCGLCGSPTTTRQAGYVRTCTARTCAAAHFPRVDPAVIVLVSDGEHCLLGRPGRWPTGLYSALAGFVEPGETLEEAVAREVKEETGLALADVRYHSSQPWPFPSSLMLGFHATTARTDIVIARDELEDARWFSRELLCHPPEGLHLPRRDSIARRLLEDWLAGER